MADVVETEPVQYPSRTFVETLSVVAAVLSAGAIIAQATVKVAQQVSKSQSEKAGIEGAIRLSVAATVARTVPAVLGEIRTIGRELQRKR